MKLVALVTVIFEKPDAREGTRGFPPDVKIIEAPDIASFESAMGNYLQQKCFDGKVVSHTVTFLSQTAS